MPRLSAEDEKELEEKFHLASRQAHDQEEKTTVKDYALVIGIILLITGLMFYTVSVVLGGSMMSMGLAAILYKFLPW